MKERKGCSSAYKRKMLGNKKKECILCAVPAGWLLCPIGIKAMLSEEGKQIVFHTLRPPPTTPPGPHSPENPFPVARNVCLKMIL